MELLRQSARDARRTGELPAVGDPRCLALELSTMLTGADIASLLHDDPAILTAIRRTIRRRLAAHE